MSLWNIQVYVQGKLVSIDVVEEAEVQPMADYLEDKGYEVRSEPAWKPARSIHQKVEVSSRQASMRAIANQPPYKAKKREY